MVTKKRYRRLKSPALAAFLSFFYMGLGHIYIGEIRKGVSLILLYSASLALVPVLIGLITTPMLWIRGMVYAHESAKNMNSQIAAGLATPSHPTQEAGLLPDQVHAEPLAE